MSKYDFKRIILCAGHSPQDPGAVNGQFKEAEQAVKIVNKTNSMLKNIGVDTLVVPHELDFFDSTKWINSNWKDEDLVIEVHRDSAVGVDFTESSTRLGVYHVGGDDYSKKLGDTLASIFRAKSNNKNTWSRPDTNIGSLYLIRETKPTALLVELGFMQGRNDDEHINWLSQVLYESIVELIGFKKPEIKSEPKQVIDPCQNQKNELTEKDKKIEELVKNYSLINEKLVISEKQRLELEHRAKKEIKPDNLSSEVKKTTDIANTDVSLDFKSIYYGFLQKLTSRKFLIAILTFFLPIINSKFDLNLKLEEILLTITGSSIYIASQAQVDMKNK